MHVPTFLASRINALLAPRLGRLARFALLGLASWSLAIPVAVSEVTYRLTVLHNNDGESVLLPRRVETEQGSREFGGAARFVTLVKALKREALGVPTVEPGVARGVLVLSAGDNFLAGPIFAASLRNGPPYFDAAAMLEVGYDAVGIGNHEFDFGPEILASFVEDFSAEIPFLAANLDVSHEPKLAALVEKGRIAKSVLVEKGGQKIGLVGAITELLATISSPRKVRIHEVVPAVRREVDRLTAAGANKILLLSHLQHLDREMGVVAELSDVDAVIAGGGNELLANPEHVVIPGEREQVAGPYPILVKDADGRAVPVVTTNGRYSYVGRLVLGFNARGEIVEIDSANSGPIPVAGPGGVDAVKADPEVERRVTAPVRSVVGALAKQVVAISRVPLDGRRTSVRTGETNLGNLLADALLWQARELAETYGVPAPQVALQNSGGIRNDALIPTGEITEFGTFEVAPFPNFISIVTEVSRENFKELLENAVSQGEKPAGRFAQVGGFSMEWDPSEPPRQINAGGEVIHPGSRVRSVVLADGTEIVREGALVAGPALNIATVDFLARGGDQYPFRGREYVTLGVTYQQALRNYIVEELEGEIGGDRYSPVPTRIVRRK